MSERPFEIREDLRAITPYRAPQVEEDSAVAVHDRLGQPGRARREQDVQRVIEGNGFEGERSGRGGECAARLGNDDGFHAGLDELPAGYGAPT